MLQYLRRGRRLQIVIVGFLAAIFCVWGISGVLTSRQTSPYAGELFGRKIPISDYARVWELTRQNLREIYRVDLPKELVDEQAWIRLLLMAEAKHRRLEIPDPEVVARIQSISFFQRNGAFDRDLYETFLRLRRTSPRAFEEAVREDLAIARLRAEVLSGLTFSDEEVRQAYARTYEQARVAYVLADAVGFLEQARAQATPETLQAYFTAHAQEFTQPAAVTLEYLAFRLADLPAPDMTEEAIQAYYLTHQQQLVATDPGTVPPATPTPAVHERVQHILQTQQREDAFDALVVKVEAWLEKGKTLEALSREFDRPIQTTGFFSQDEPIPGIGASPEVTAQAFRLAAQEPSGWIDAQGGGYVIRVKEQRPARNLAFEEVTAKVQEGWAAQRARELAQAKAAEVAAACAARLAAGESFDAVAQHFGLAVQRPDPFTRTGYIAGLGVEPAFARAAFALAPGAAGEPVEVRGGFAVVQLIEILPVDGERFTKERVTFAETLRRQKQDAHFQAWLADLKTRARLVSYLDRRS